MSRTHVVWSYFAAVSCVLGVAVALLVMPAGVVVSIAVISAVGAWAASSMLPGSPSVPRALIMVLVSALAAVATIGLIAAMGVVGLTVVAAVAVTSPAAIGAIRQLGRRWAADDRDPAASADAPSLAEPVARRRPRSTDLRHQERWNPSKVASLPDAELCLAWRISYTALERRPTGEQHVAIASFRAAVLDELQHRHPVGFGRWIDAGARAASDPARYLLAGSRPADRTQRNPPRPY